MVAKQDRSVSDQADMTAAVQVSAMLRAISHPMRLLAVYRLSQGERSVSELQAEIGIDQPALSQHLTVLRAAGVVTTRRKSKNIFYRLADDKSETLSRWLTDAFPADSRAGTERH
jgi:DNA-binding transcriptional ArsR family regulator